MVIDRTRIPQYNWSKRHVAKPAVEAKVESTRLRSWNVQTWNDPVPPSHVQSKISDYRTYRLVVKWLNVVHWLALALSLNGWDTYTVITCDLCWSTGTIYWLNSFFNQGTSVQVSSKWKPIDIVCNEENTKQVFYHFFTCTNKYVTNSPMWQNNAQMSCKL